jgi:uncharacterized metal-binding protein
MLTWQLTYRKINIYFIDATENTAEWRRVCDLASQGWELVSVTPIIEEGNTRMILYTFKRPNT